MSSINKKATQSIFTIKGSTGNKYKVDIENNTCTCPHFEYRLKGTKQICKHIKQVGNVLKSRKLKYWYVEMKAAADKPSAVVGRCHTASCRCFAGDTTFCPERNVGDGGDGGDGAASDKFINKVTFKQRAARAILELHDNKGSSLQAIKKFLSLDPSKWRYLNNALYKGVRSGFFVKNKGKYKLAGKKNTKVAWGNGKPSENSLRVKSPSGNIYEINLVNKTCTCPHYIYRLKNTAKLCKHLQKVKEQGLFKKKKVTFSELTPHKEHQDYMAKIIADAIAKNNAWILARMNNMISEILRKS